MHQDQTFNFENPGDALKHAPNGGCTLICDDILSCGHQCNSICHLMDQHTHTSNSIGEFWRTRVPSSPMFQEGLPGVGFGRPTIQTCKRAANFTGAHTGPHFEVKPLHSSETICWATCNRKCDAGIHTCRKACVIKCGSNCEEIVCKELRCGHSANVKCSTNAKEIDCMQKVEKNFPLCQHRGIMPCSSYRKCPMECASRMSCGHSCVRKCHVYYDPDHLMYICLKPCGERKKNCSADHPCMKACHEDCDLCVEKV
jgi:hypothetical protein